MMKESAIIPYLIDGGNKSKNCAKLLAINQVIDAAEYACINKQPIRAASIVGRYVSDLLTDEDFEKVNEFLKAVDTSMLEPSVLSSILMVTSHAKHIQQIQKNRNDFFNRAMNSMRDKWDVSEERIAAFTERLK